MITIKQKKYIFIVKHAEGDDVLIVNTAISFIAKLDTVFVDKLSPSSALALSQSNRYLYHSKPEKGKIIENLYFTNCGKHKGGIVTHKFVTF